MSSVIAAPKRAREYETIYIMRPDVPREGAAKVAQRVQEVLQREGAKLTLVETWGRRELAYKVKKHRYGIYVYVKFIATGMTVTELERNFRLLDEVMKFQTILLGEVEGEVEVSEESVAFEPVEGVPVEEDAAQALARELGLLDPEPGSRGQARSQDVDEEDEGDEDE